MNIRQQITLLWWLSSGYRKKLISTTASIMVGACITTGLLTLSASVHQTLMNELGTPKSQYFLKQRQLNIGPLNLQGTLLKDRNLDTEAIADLRQTDGVDAVYPEMWVTQPVSLSGRLMGVSLVSDATLLGVDPDAIEEDKRLFSWSQDEAIPIMAPQMLVVAYNSGFAASNNLPRLNAKSILNLADDNLKLKVHVGRSSLSGSRDKRKNYGGRLGGITKYGGILAGIIPLSAAQQIAKDFDQDPNSFTGALLQVKEGISETQRKKIESKVNGYGFVMEAQNSTIKTISSLLRILDLWITVTGAVIFLAGGIALAQLYQLLLVERKQELQTLRYFGARFTQILSLLLMEVLSVISLGMVLGTALGIASAKLCFPFIESKVDEVAGISFPIENTVVHPWTFYMVFGVMVFVLLLIFPMLWRLRAQKGLEINT